MCRKRHKKATFSDAFLPALQGFKQRLHSRPETLSANRQAQQAKRFNQR